MDIKSPADNIAGKKDSTRGGPGEYNGEPGYQKRSPHSGPEEKTYEGIKPKQLDIKSPEDNR